MAGLIWPQAVAIRSAGWGQRVPRIRQTSAWTGRTREVALGTADRWTASVDLAPTLDPAPARALLAALARPGACVRLGLCERPQGGASGNMVADAGFSGAGWGLYNTGGIGGSKALSPGPHGQRFQAKAGATVGSRLGAANSAALPTGWRAGVDYVISFWAWTDAAATGGCVLSWPGVAPATLALANPVLSAGWQRYAFRVRWGQWHPALNGADGGALSISADVAGFAGGKSIYLDGVQVEEALAAGAWAAGTTLPAAPAGATGAAFAGAPASSLLARAGERVSIPLAAGGWQAVTLLTPMESAADGTGLAAWAQPLRDAAASAPVVHRWPFAEMRLLSEAADNVSPGPVYAFSSIDFEEAF